MLAKAIKNCLPLFFEFDGKIIAPFHFMGNILFQYHKYIENSKVAQILYLNSLQRKKSICNFCGLDLFQKYMENGIGMLEFHFFENIMNYNRMMKPLQSKFTPLCPNCHKFAHLSLENFIIDKFV